MELVLINTNLYSDLYSHDLVSALQELGLEGAINVSDLMQQMGADTQGKVSYEQFLHCRLSHKTEIEALRDNSGDTNLPQMTGGWMHAKDLCGKNLTCSSKVLFLK